MTPALSLEMQMGVGPRAHSPEALTVAFEAETRLLGELLELMQRQRAGVAANDVQEVDHTVFATHRVLRTIGEARRRRRALVAGLAGAEDVEVLQLDVALGPLMTEPLRRAWDELQAQAQTLSREIALNREVLHEALRAGDDYMRALCGGPQTSVAYDAGARAVESGRPGGSLLNRQV